MANGEFLDALSDRAFADIKKYNGEILDIIKNVSKVREQFDNIKMPSQSNDAIKQLNEDYKKQEIVLNKLQLAYNKLAESQKSIEKVKPSQIAFQKQLEAETKARQSLDAQRQKALISIEKEAQKLAVAENLYNKVQAKLNTLQNEYKALAVQKELIGRLTDAESKRYDFLQGKITKYDGALKAVDATMGKHQRNVGNYGSAFNPVSNSINQLTREMPAFANSVQTGFMAISNNLPIFFDAMQQAIAQQKELQAQGQPSKNALQVLASGFFTLGTALSVGVTLLTLFGPKIIDAIFNTEQKKKADEDAKIAIEAKNKAEKDYIETLTKAGSEEISRSQILFENSKNVNLSMKDRLDAIKQLKERYPDYLGHLSNEAILSGNTADSENRLNDALIKRGIAIAIQSKLTEEYNKLTTVLLRIDKLKNNSNNLTKEEIELGSKIGLSNSQLSKDKAMITKISMESALKDKKAVEGQIEGIFKLYNQYAPYLSAVNESTKATEKKVKVKKELEKIDADSLEAMQRTISALQDEQSKVSFGSATYEALGAQLKIVQTIYDGLTQKATETTEAINGVELSDEEVYAEYFAWLKLKDATDDYLKTITSDAFNTAFDSIGLSSAKMFLDFDKNGQTTFDKLIDGADTLGEKMAITFKAVGDVAKEVFSFMQDSSRENFEIEKQQLDEQYKISTAFAGDSVAAKKELDKQYEIKQREIKNREAKSNKDMAIFNASINVVQGVTSALATANIPLAITIGVIGALQIAAIRSKEIPKYFKGGKHKGGLGMINDGEGSNYIETIKTPDGKISQYADRNLVLDMPSGTEIFTPQQWEDYQMKQLLKGTGVVMPKVSTNKEVQGFSDIQVSRIVDAVKNMPKTELNFDNGKFTEHVKNGHQTKINLNARLTFAGENV